MWADGRLVHAPIPTTSRGRDGSGESHAGRMSPRHMVVMPSQRIDPSGHTAVRKETGARGRPRGVFAIAQIEVAFGGQDL